jgi:hypothetical protein
LTPSHNTVKLYIQRKGEAAVEESEVLVKMTVLVPKGLHRRAKVRAAETDVDMRDVVIAALEAFLGSPAAVTKKGRGRR